MDPTDVMKTTCDDFLSTLQLSLHVCKNNKDIYNFTHNTISKFKPHDCDNVNQYIKSLCATNTVVVFNTPTFNTKNPYSIEYNVTNRLLIVDDNI